MGNTIYQSMTMGIKETSSFGDIESIFTPEISIETDMFGELTIGTVSKDDNDERSVYFVLNKQQALILSDILKRFIE